MDRYWTRKSVLVTGCTGLVGAWLVDALVARGATVVGLVRDMVPRSNLYRLGLDRHIAIARGDVCDFDCVLRVLNEYEVDTVFHLAAQTIVGIANRAPLSTFDTNIRGTWNVLEAARHTPTLARLVIASSDKAYGAQEDLPYREDAPLVGLHPYDASKSCADLLSQAYHHAYRLPVGISRCGNIFGGGDLNFNRIVPETMRAVFYGERPVIRSDGSPTRDYLFVEDVAEAYIALARALDDPAHHGKAFNFSYEQPQTVLEIVNHALELLGRGDLLPDVRGSGLPQGEIPHQFLSAERAREELGWRPRFGLDQGLRLTYRWYEALFRDLEADRNRVTEVTEQAM
ncbi:MAG: NAD-dependent epimerase/dehydratase family protein [Rhodospirillales bacterium]|nr:MAG: NAD-dependent epimerase/dehydratase family protein [Rhodospirillales bacterium]